MQYVNEIPYEGNRFWISIHLFILLHKIRKQKMNSLKHSLAILAFIVSTAAYADLDCTGQQNGEQQIGGCWNCEESVKQVLNNAYLWKIELGSGELTVNNTDQSKAVYACAEEDKIRVNISVSFTTPAEIPITNIDGFQCRVRSG